jgi:hypothetical protein
MRTQTTISILTAAALALTSMSAVAQGRHGGSGAQQTDRARIERSPGSYDRDRVQQRDRVTNPSQSGDQIRKKDQLRKKDQVHKPADAGQGQKGIYGSQLMSVEERNEFQEQLRLTENNPEARTRLMAEHREKMQQRAKAKGVGIDEAPANGAKE